MRRFWSKMIAFGTLLSFVSLIHAAEPVWSGRATYRVLVQVPAMELGGRTHDTSVASCAVDFPLWLAQHKINGQFDPSFGVKGILTLSSPNVQDLPFAYVIDSNGALTLAAGTFTQHDGESRSVIRR